MSKSPKNSTDFSKELKIGIGWEPSTMFCRKVKPDVPAYNSKYIFNLGCKTISPYMFEENVNGISWLVILMVSLPV